MKDVIDTYARSEIDKLREFILKDIAKSTHMWRLQIRINTISTWAKLAIGIASILSLALSIAALAIAMKGVN